MLGWELLVEAQRAFLVEFVTNIELAVSIRAVSTILGNTQTIARAYGCPWLWSRVTMLVGNPQAYGLISLLITSEEAAEQQCL